MNAGSPAAGTPDLPRLVALWAFFLLPLAFWPQFEDAFKLPQFVLALALGAAALRRTGFSFRGWRLAPFLLGCAHLAGWVLFPDARLSDTLWFVSLLFFALSFPSGAAAGYAGAKLLDLGIAAAALAALYSIVQFAGLDAVGGDFGRIARPFSTMGNPDFFAAYLLAVLPLALILAARRPSVFRIASVVLIASGLLLAQSRGAWLGLLAAGAAAAAAVKLSGRSLRPSRPAWALIGVCLLAAGGFFAFSSGAHDRAARMFDLKHFDAAGRLLMWDIGMRMIREKPLAGGGLGSYGKNYPARHARAQAADPGLPYFYSENAHNDYLQLGAEQGMLGLGLWAWVWAVFLRLAWRKWLRGSPEALGLLAGFAGFQVNALFNFPWYLIPAQAWFWVALARLAAAPGRAEPGARLGPLWLAALAAGFIPLSRAIQADAWLKISGDAVAASDWPRALVSARQALGRWTAWEGRERAAVNASLAAYGLGDWTGSEEYARLGLKTSPDSPSLYNQIGLSLARRGKFQRAEEAFRRALALNPRQAESYHALGNLAYLRGDTSEAVRFWRRSLEENPGLEGARTSLDQALSGKIKPGK